MRWLSWLKIEIPWKTKIVLGVTNIPGALVLYHREIKTRRSKTNSSSSIVVKIFKNEYWEGVQVFRFVVAVGLMVASVGCQNTYQQSTTEAKPEAAPLRSNTRVYIAMPEDALDKKTPVASSGRRTTIALQEAFQRHTKGVVVAKVPESLTESIARARDLSCEYVAVAEIVKWEDRLTEWNGVRDKLEMKIDLLSVATGQAVRTTSIQGKSRFMTDGDDAPQDLLSEPVDRFVRTLFRTTYTPSALQK